MAHSLLQGTSLSSGSTIQTLSVATLPQAWSLCSKPSQEQVHDAQEAKDAAAAAVKAQEEEQRQKAAEAARQQEELAQNQRAMEEQKAKDLAQLEARTALLFPSYYFSFTPCDLHFWHMGIEMYALTG